MFFNSIRVRLQLWYGLILVGILAGFGFTAWQLQWGSLHGRLNGELDRRANFLERALHRHRGGPGEGGLDGGEPPFDRPPPELRDGPPEGGGPGAGSPDEMLAEMMNSPLPPEAAGLFDPGDPGNYYFIIYAHDGREIRRSTNAPAVALIQATRAPEPSPSLARNPPPEPVRISGERAELEKRLPMGGAIVVGCSIAPELKELKVTAVGLSLAGGIILMFGLGGGWWLAGRAIRPVEDISAAAAKISAGDLSQRINLTETESELGRLATVLNSTFARLDAAFAQQKQFTSDAAHELRTPVSVMLTQTQTSLGRERTAAEYRQTVEACQRAAQRMRRLIESLLALARLDAGQEPMKRANFDVASSLHDCADLVRPLAEERGVSLVLDLHPVECAGDSERLGQVFTNLLTNAIQYNRAGGEVRVTVERQNDAVIVTVRDTGPGIAAEDLPRVFERFYRSDKSRSTGGNGLGLSICKAIIDAHGGSIEVSSEAGVGTTFIVRLPAA